MIGFFSATSLLNSIALFWRMCTLCFSITWNIIVTEKAFNPPRNLHVIFALFYKFLCNEILSSMLEQQNGIRVWYCCLHSRMKAAKNSNYFHNTMIMQICSRFLRKTTKYNNAQVSTLPQYHHRRPQKSLLKKACLVRKKVGRNVVFLFVRVKGSKPEIGLTWTHRLIGFLTVGQMAYDKW